MAVKEFFAVLLTLTICVNSFCVGRVYDRDFQDNSVKKPGWLQRTINKINNAANSFGEKVGESVKNQSRRIAGVIDRACEKVKGFAPLLAVICHFGHFRLCPSSDQLEPYLPPDSEVKLQEKFLTKNEMNVLKRL